ncbi:hypothetical protein [Herpetosiphon llansteffanensis]|uniref:hypothetical protein n=1 Tax=Herpetosiphon llansteffanensis TaxID=2094568 RepID=UPI000F51A432|nr:hypothetical protein [Herpetosiphon llansteffanensis]
MFQLFKFLAFKHTSAHHWRLLLIIILVATSMITAPSSAMAACSGVFTPRFRYHCDVILANNAIFTGFSYKKYNEIYEGNGSSVAIYFKDSNNNNLYTTYGSSYAFKIISPGTLKAACWNTSSNSITAKCDYFDAETR